jgi:hypothetical protein
MPFDRGHDLEVNAGRVGSVDVFQERLVELSACEGSRQERAASLVAHRTSKVLGYLRARLLHRRAKAGGLRRAGGLALE